MKNTKSLKKSTLAITVLLLVVMMTAALQALIPVVSGPDANGYMTYTIPADADPDETANHLGDPFGSPYAKYNPAGAGTFIFAEGAPGATDLFIVTLQYNGSNRATCTFQLRPDAGKRFVVSSLTAKQQVYTWKFDLNITLNPGDKIVGLPAPGNGNDFSHVNVYGITTPLIVPTTTATTQSTTQATTTATTQSTTQATTTATTQSTTQATTTATTSSTTQATTTATTAATTQATTTLATTQATTTLATIIVTDPTIPLVSTVVTTAGSTPTVTIPEDPIPLPNTGEALSWAPIAGVALVLFSAVVIWKRRMAKAED